MEVQKTQNRQHNFETEQGWKTELPNFKTAQKSTIRQGSIDERRERQINETEKRVQKQTHINIVNFDKGTKAL